MDPQHEERRLQDAMMTVVGFRTGRSHPKRKEEDQGENHETAPLDQPKARGVNCYLMSQTFRTIVTSNNPVYLTTDSEGGRYGNSDKDGLY